MQVENIDIAFDLQDIKVWFLLCDSEIILNYFVASFHFILLI